MWIKVEKEPQQINASFHDREKGRKHREYKDITNSSQARLHNFLNDLPSNPDLHITFGRITVMEFYNVEFHL